MNLPNKITVSRLVLTPIALTMLFLEQVPYNFFIATILFTIAMLTDLLDGYIARKYNLVTKLGRFLDPLADKLLILLFIIFLQSKGVYPLWLVLAFVGRELIVDGLRSFALGQNVYMGAIRWGKYKAFFQTISIIIALISICSLNSQLFGIKFKYDSLISAAYILMLIGFVFGLIGSAKHFKANIALLKDKK